MKILNVKTRQRNIGNIGERAAARYLFFRGYRILKRNAVFDTHEVDIIAKRGFEIVFVEVKTRSTETLSEFDPPPRVAVTKEKMAGIIKEAGMQYGMLRYTDDRFRARFDVIEVYLKGGRVDRIEHLISAYTKNTAKTRRKRK